MYSYQYNQGPFTRRSELKEARIVMHENAFSVLVIRHHDLLVCSSFLPILHSSVAHIRWHHPRIYLLDIWIRQSFIKLLQQQFDFSERFQWHRRIVISGTQSEMFFEVGIHERKMLFVCLFVSKLCNLNLAALVATWGGERESSSTII